MTIIDFLDEPARLLVKPPGEPLRYYELSDNQLANLLEAMARAMARRVRIPLCSQAK